MKVPGEPFSRVEFNDNFLLFLNFILIISFDCLDDLISEFLFRTPIRIFAVRILLYGCET